MRNDILKQVSKQPLSASPSLNGNMAPKANANATTKARDKANDKANANATKQQTPSPAKPKRQVGVLKDKATAGSAKGWGMMLAGKPMGQLRARAVNDHLKALTRKGNPQPLEHDES